MKKASKVFIVMGIVYQIIMSIMYFAILMSGNAGNKEGVVVFLWFISLTGFIVGLIALSKLKDAKKAADLKLTAILTLLFCNLIGGILMLCLSDGDLKPVKKDDSEDTDEQDDE